MKIVRVETWRERVPLTRPYTIASGTTEDVELFFVRVVGEREIGLGSGVPIEFITDETSDACAASFPRHGSQRSWSIPTSCPFTMWASLQTTASTSR